MNLTPRLNAGVTRKLLYDDTNENNFQSPSGFSGFKVVPHTFGFAGVASRNNSLVLFIFFGSWYSWAVSSPGRTLHLQ